MRLTCYLDESGTHDSSATTIMAGYVAHNAAWSKFEKRWEKAHERFGLTHFHGTDAKKRNGQYKGWNQESLDAYFYITDKLANQQSLFGLVCRLDNAEYDRIYKVTGQRPKGMVAPDSRYGLCFRGCISFIVRVLLQKYLNKKSLTLDVVLEAGHRNVGDAQRIFADMKAGAEQSTRDILGQLTIAEKLSCAGVRPASLRWVPSRKRLGRVRD